MTILKMNRFSGRCCRVGMLLLIAACNNVTPPVDTAPVPSATAGVSHGRPSAIPEKRIPDAAVVRPKPPVSVARGNRAPVVKNACTDARYEDPLSPGYRLSDAARDTADKLLRRLSLKEKADQIRGTSKGVKAALNWQDIFRSLDNAEKRIRGFRFRDGPRGLNLDAGCREGASCYATVFPTAIARGAAFDPELEYRIGRAVGDETVAAGHTMMLAPTINIVRHPAWGRTQESYGEDPFLLGKLGTAFVVGVQKYVPACAKHFIANNVEEKRSDTNALMDEQTLREVYGAAYEMAIREGGVACIMASYNKVNGIPVVEHSHILTDILRDDFGFEGFVVSDWWALANPFKVDLSPQVYEASAKRSLEAGVDMEMPWSLNYEYLEEMVEKGMIDEALVERSARRVLEQKARFNIANMDAPIGLDRPSTRLGDDASIKGNEAHLNLAYEAALESAVLLKNENGVLPIDTKKVKTVAVLGADVPYAQRKHASKPSGRIDFSTDVALGDLGSSRVNGDPKQSIGPYAGIKMAAGDGITVVRGNSATAAEAADFVVVVVGLTPGDEGEEYTGAGDRRSFALDAKIVGTPQRDLISAAVALGKPMAVVLVGGSVIEMPWLASVPAVVMSWYSGIEGGRALGELLFGKQNFSGKLPLTWPNRFDELPVFDPGVPNPVNMDYYLGYRYYDEKTLTPLFPFGHGESYTTFEYANLEVPCGTVTKDGIVTVKADVTNTGTVSGEEVVFLFVAYPETKARRPVKALKGFTRVRLAPKETRQVTIPLRIRDLRYWDVEKHRWEVETGKVTVMVGGTSNDLPLSDVFEVI